MKKMKQGIIDRFEGPLAIVELTPDEFITIPRDQLPKQAQVGDCLIFEQLEIKIDSDKTLARRKEIEQLMDELFES